LLEVRRGKGAVAITVEDLHDVIRQARGPRNPVAALHGYLAEFGRYRDFC
jgi:hypothetical protein